MTIICEGCGKVNPSNYKIIEDGILCEECAKPVEYMSIEDCKKCKFFDAEKAFCTEPTLMEVVKPEDRFVCGRFIDK